MLSQFHERVLSSLPAIGRRSSLPIAAALALGVAGYGPVLAAEKASTEPGTVSFAQEAITQNTPGFSEGYPSGVPNTYTWCNGSSKQPESNAPPSDFTSVTALGSVYPRFGVPDYFNPEGKVIVTNAKTFVRIRATKEWVVVQDQSEDEIAGAHFSLNAARDSAAEAKVEAQPEGITVISSPPAGHNDALWFVKRGSFAAGTVDAVYVQMDMKTTDPKLKLVANVGADWWRTPEAPFVLGADNSRGAGNSNWVELSTEWSTLHFFSSTTEQLSAKLPPPLAEAGTKQIAARRVSDTASPCLRTLKPR